MPKEKSISWIGYVKRFSLFIPYVWPANKPLLQLRMLGAGLGFVTVRFLKVLAPRQMGIVINAFQASPGHLPVSELLWYVFLDWTAQIITGSIEIYLWLPVRQNAHRAIASSTYHHIMNLSGDFHDDKKSGELMSTMDQGNAIYQLFESITFGLLPILADLLLACGYLSYIYGMYMAFLVLTTTAMYLGFTKALTAREATLLRGLVETSQNEYQVRYDTLSCWTSVAYFSNFAHEQKHYVDAVASFLRAEFKYGALQNAATAVQDSMLEIGFIGACLLAGHQVATGIVGVASFVVLLDYWSRFTGRWVNEPNRVIWPS